MNEPAEIEYVFGPGEPNPGCDCGMHDAQARLVGGVLVCAGAITESVDLIEQEEDA